MSCQRFYLSRLSLFRGFLQSISGGMASKLVGLLIASLLLMMAISACSDSSYEHPVFRETEFGIPRMYYLGSEKAVGGFVSSHHTGVVSCNVVFSADFFYYVPSNQVKFDISMDTANSSYGNKIVRLTELKKRGLEYTENGSYDFITYDEYQESYFREKPNCVAYVGTSRSLTAR